MQYAEDILMLNVVVSIMMKNNIFSIKSLNQQSLIKNYLILFPAHTYIHKVKHRGSSDLSIFLIQTQIAGSAININTQNQLCFEDSLFGNVF